MIKIEKDYIEYIGFQGDSKKIKANELPFHLNDDVKIGEGVTFERIFKLIIQNNELFNIIFSSHTGGYLIDQYIEEFSKDADEDNDWEKNMSHIEVYRYFEHFIYRHGEEENSLYYGIHGIGNDKDKTNYGFMGSSINNYKHLPIKINEHIDFRIDTGKDLHGKDAVPLDEKYKIVHSGDIPINLFQFIGTILYEISWHGTPEERDERFDELKEISDRIDSGEEKLIEMKWDDNGDVYFVDEDGNKEYFGFDDNSDE